MRWKVCSPFLFCAIATVAAPVAAHPLILPKAMVEIEGPSLRMVITYDVAALVMQAGRHLDDLLAEELRTMPEPDVSARLEDVLTVLRAGLHFECDGHAIKPTSIELPTAEQLQATTPAGTGPMNTLIRIAAELPAEARRLAITLPADLGPMELIVRASDMPLFHQPLPEGQKSFPVPLRADVIDNTPQPSWFKTAVHYLFLGFEHIVPKGLDHILFVLGLFLLTPGWRPLLWQVTAFTLAHSITLALAMFQVVALSPDIVEPLIALSIVLIAVENIVTSTLQPWRPAVVFGFGLLHGLGFAGVLSELGLPPGQLILPLVTFNIGVELGQLAVILVAFLLVGHWQTKPWYRQRIVIPASLAIAAVALYWTWERTLG